MKDEIVAELKSLKACIVYACLIICIFEIISREKERTAVVTVELVKALWDIILRIEQIHNPEYDPENDIINVCIFLSFRLL
jgi:hypothetical protein